jgi:hypothetical protein
MSLFLVKPRTDLFTKYQYAKSGQHTKLSIKSRAVFIREIVSTGQREKCRNSIAAAHEVAVWVAVFKSEQLIA